MKIISYKNFKAQIMKAPRLKDDGIHVLPPGDPLDIYYSDEFINYPENWMKGPGIFVVPVLPETGLWFDWTFNHMFTYDKMFGKHNVTAVAVYSYEGHKDRNSRSYGENVSQDGDVTIFGY